MDRHVISRVVGGLLGAILITTLAATGAQATPSAALSAVAQASPGFECCDAPR